MRPLKILFAALLLAGCGGSSGGGAATAPTESAAATASGGGQAAKSTAKAAAVRLQKVGSFDSPVYVTSPPGDTSRLFVVEQGGKVRVIKNGKTLDTPFLDVSDKIVSGSEQGLLSIAFAPDYAASGLFYVFYTDTDGNETVVEYQRSSDDVADAGSARKLFTVQDPEPNHNGGLLLFGPDKHLYIGIGDGGGAGDQHGPRGNAQNLGTLLGKILRIDPKASGGKPYAVPSDNPFVNRSGAKPEIYSYGLRNPWRFSFDRSTGDLAIGDVGQNEVEEIDFVRKGKGRGANFGWRPFEGNDRFAPGESAPGAIKPVITERHEDGNCSITGGIIIRDPALSSWRGRYVFGDYCRGVIQTAVLASGKASNLTDRKLKVSQLSSFGEDARGRVYATSLDGPVYRFVQ
ncbi:PQQ-dependent sugar dehydrogenase [Solirubrobacter ginsenosidimutans]|uniref:PQQ-dependent sugar dehydrogenase n=1 Tax=Solirubrobacter ginsenosidimutans TaxID=490573 RepID=A0A9X3MWT0_9ACTN|nr:PQQ-dependent sugar dehydrogenase [Solirubrobacter ginsenosidimutans]MDA0162697.1 PQQ-dependent sugar dehydrogenase [Solirubrobacter ginsenosidimutans]